MKDRLVRGVERSSVVDVIAEFRDLGDGGLFALLPGFARLSVGAAGASPAGGSWAGCWTTSRAPPARGAPALVTPCHSLPNVQPSNHADCQTLKSLPT